MLLTILLSALLILIDRVLKILAVRYLAPVGTAGFIPGILGFRYVENNGAAFSFFSGMQSFLIIITAIALLAALYILLFRRPKGNLEYYAILLIFAGGVGNLIDRIARGYVVDYLEFLFIPFAIFNFADILITFGFVMIVFAVARSEYRESKAKKLAQASAGENVTDSEPSDNTIQQTAAETSAFSTEKGSNSSKSDKYNPNEVVSVDVEEEQLADSAMQAEQKNGKA